MSDTVLSYGFMAVLEKEVDPNEISEILWEKHSTLRVNGEGTLAYIDFSDHDSLYGLFIGVKGMDVYEFYAECEKFGLSVDKSTTQPYTCVWYNGGDSDMAMLTKEEFIL